MNKTRKYNRIALLNPFLVTSSGYDIEVVNRKGHLSEPPLGLAYISAYIKQFGYTVKIIDANIIAIKGLKNGEYKNTNEAENAIIERITKRALQGVKYCTELGMRVHISTTITHQNLHTDGVIKLLDFSRELVISIDMQCATVSGGWHGNLDVLLTDEDADYILKLRDDYPLIRRDLLPTPGFPGGCVALKNSFFITSVGDILPCIFIHVLLGNIFEEPLDTILQRGLRVKELREFSSKCLVGEDRSFINRFLKKNFTTNEMPLKFEDVFEEYID